MSGRATEQVSSGTASAFDVLALRASRTRITCLGLSALDVVWRVEKSFAGDSEKIRATDHEIGGGGMAATAAVAIARFGAQAAFWGRAGADAAGDQMRALLADEGVDVGQFRLFPEGRSSVSGIVVDAAGERQVVNFRGHFPEDAGWLPLNQVKNASAVLADPRWIEGALALFRAARETGIPTVLDADVADADVFETLLPLTDHAIFSAPALGAFRHGRADEALTEIAEYGCQVAAVTRGADGVIWREDGHVHHHPAVRVDAVDTTGAGDVFHGAYALGVGAGLGTADVMAFASVAAALKCTRPGGRSGIPTLHDCLAFLRINA